MEKRGGKQGREAGGGKEGEWVLGSHGEGQKGVGEMGRRAGGEGEEDMHVHIKSRGRTTWGEPC